MGDHPGFGRRKGGHLVGNLLGIDTGGFNITTLIVAVIGACVLLLLLGLVKRRA